RPANGIPADREDTVLWAIHVPGDSEDRGPAARKNGLNRTTPIGKSHPTQRARKCGPAPHQPASGSRSTSPRFVTKNIFFDFACLRATKVCICHSHFSNNGIDRGLSCSDGTQRSSG